MRMHLPILAAILAAVPAHAAEKLSPVKIVGFDQLGLSVLVHFEEEAASAEQSRLYLVVATLTEGEAYPVRFFDGYAGLREWVAAHPKASEKERQAAARKLRGANWKAMEADLARASAGGGDIHIDLDYRLTLDGAAKREDTRTADWEITRFAFSDPSLVVIQRCKPGTALQGCEVFTEAGGRRVAMMTGVALAAVYHNPGNTMILTVERNARFDPEKDRRDQLQGVRCFHYQDLLPGPDRVPAPGELFLAKVKGHQRLRETALLDSKRVAWVEDGQLLRVRQAQSGVDQTESVPVALAQEGAWVEGWIHRRILATPAPKTYVPLLALQLSDSVTGQPGALRYRIVVKNETAEPAALPASKLGVFYTRPNAVGSNAVSLPPRTIPARSEAVLLDEALVETGDGFAAPFGDSRTDLFARRDPPPQSVSTRVSLEMEAPKVRLVAAEHKLTLPAGALEPAK